MDMPRLLSPILPVLPAVPIIAPPQPPQPPRPTEPVVVALPPADPAPELPPSVSGEADASPVVAERSRYVPRPGAPSQPTWEEASLIDLYLSGIEARATEGPAADPDEQRSRAAIIAEAAYALITDAQVRGRTQASMLIGDA